MANKGMKGLLVWCKRHTEEYNDVNITNMTSSWSSGLGFCALLHRFRPDLIDFESLSKENVLYNNQLAFEIAEKELGIAALLDAEDMANMAVPDRLSVMTYLSQYYNCFRHCKPEENSTQTDAPVVNPTATASPSKTTSPPRRSTDDSICCICGKRVHLVQRYFDGGKLYHRTCHRNDSLEKIRGKNYFVKEQDKEESAKKNMDDEEKAGNPVCQQITPNVPKPHNNAVPQHENKSVPSSQPQEPKLVLPNLVESLVHTKGQTINITAATPSPTTEDKPPPSIPHDVAPSLISELPVARYREKEPDKSNGTPAMPKPRARTLHSLEGEIVPAPVARPRSKDIHNVEKSVEKEDKQSNENVAKPLENMENMGGSNYDKLMNPFELSSGSDSDTTLSSTSSEDDNNPFISSTSTQNKISHKSNNVSLKENDGGSKTPKERFNPFGDPEELQNHEEKESDNEGNPFGDADEEVEAPTKAFPPSRLNPFSDNSHDSPKGDNKLAKKKKRPAPVPPKIPPAIPGATQQKASPSTQKRAAAPPRPPGWKDTSSQKMVELNKVNENDPRYAKSQPVKPQSPQHRLPAKKETNHNPQRLKQKHTSPKARSAPGYGYPLVKRKVEIKMSEQEIANELKLLDVQLTDYETKGVKLEEMLRFAMDNDTQWTPEEDELLQEWFELVNKKNILLREESDLVFQMQQQKLEQEHADIEFQLRKLFNKPESTKTDQDKIEEENLLQKLLEVVERRNVIINSIEEERLKEAEEDYAYEKMKKLQQNPSKKKKKNKVKKMFSKKGKKDKHQTAKETQS